MEEESEQFVGAGKRGFQRPFPDGCPPESVLDRLYLEDESMEESLGAELQEHVRGCEVCKARMDERDRTAIAFAEAGHPLLSRSAGAAAELQAEHRLGPDEPVGTGRWERGRSSPAGSRRRRWAALAGAAVAEAVLVALAVVWLYPLWPEVIVKGARTRTEGDADGGYLPSALGGGRWAPAGERLGPQGQLGASADAFGMYVQRPGPQQFAAGGPVQPGDRVMIAWRFSTEGYLAAYGLDAVQVTQYVPGLRDLPLHVLPGVEGLSPDSFELDETLGPERVIAVLCPAPFDAGVQLSELERFQEVGGVVPIPQGCRSKEFVMQKTPRESPP